MTRAKQHQPRLVILGAGRPFSGQQHSVLRGTSGRQRVLDWLLQAMRPVQPEVVFVGGYQLEAVTQRYPQLHYVVNPEWQSTGAAASLMAAPLKGDRAHFVSYADVLFRDTAVQALAAVEADIAVLVDSQWRHRYASRSEQDLQRCEKVMLSGDQVTRLGPEILPELADAEFAGLVKLQAKVCGYLVEQGESLPAVLRRGGLVQLLELLRSKGFSMCAVDVAGDWAELNAVEDLSRFILGTKAQTLQRLQGVVKQSRIEDQVSFTVAQWRGDSAMIRSAIAQRLASATLVVRSSALSEDGFGTSNAGAYTSVLNVDGGNGTALTAAIEKVIASYPDGHPDNQVLVQPMLAEVLAAGVAFTKTLSRGAPYYVVNYDDTTYSTDSITSGASRDHKTWFLYRDAPAQYRNAPPVLAGLLPAIREIEALLDFDSLDIEFAITAHGGVHILQVRPIAVAHGRNGIEVAAAMLETAVRRFVALQTPAAFVLGERGYFGVMPDWNPAEIIGTRPGRLATSLYRYLIMDEVWATQRAEFGYRDVRPQPLLTVFAGHPYVDIRASFNSFVPAALPEALAERLVNFYLHWLRLHPQLHDKVEFDVVPTCYALDFQRWRQRLAQEGGFTEVELDKLAVALRGITQTAIRRTAADLDAVAKLQQRFEQLRATPMAELDKALNLLQEARGQGTLVFAHLARSAFVAVTLLKSAVSEKIISSAAVEAFLNSIRTVSHHFTEDALRVARDELDWSSFVARYGHLRPGSYDINSPCYADDPEHFLRPVVTRSSPATGETSASAWLAERQAFAAALSAAGVEEDIEQLEAFMRKAIEGREYAKFAFTRHLSLALDCLAEFGHQRGLSREEMAGLSLEGLAALRAGSLMIADEQAWLLQQAEEGRRLAQAAAMVELPPLLFSEADFYGFLHADSHANFVGSTRVSAPCVALQAGASLAQELAGNIALIPQADPGYDWLFGHGIAGLITLYGGANSHMAIRAAEFGLPAAIGVGEALYARLAAATTLELDPLNKRIQVLS